MVVHAYYPHDVRVRREVEALGDRGDVVDVICLRQDGEDDYEEVGPARVHRLPVQHRRGQGVRGYAAEYLAFFLRSTVKLIQLYAQHRYAVVQVHNLPDFLVFTATVPKLLGARVLLDMHDVTPELFQSLYGVRQSSLTFKLLRLIEQASLAFADRVLTVNRNIRDLFLSRNPIADKIDEVMNAPDPRYFTPSPSEVKRNGTFRLFHHGQILRRYDFKTALEGVALAGRAVPGLRLDIYGDGEEGYIEEIKQTSERMGVSDRVQFYDRVPVERVPDLIRGADVGLVPCCKDVFVDTVMLPVRLLEYVAMGLPSIVSRVGTVQAYFEKDQVGYYNHDDPSELADRIIELYLNERLRKNRAERALRALKGLEWPDQARRYLATIDTLARGEH